MTYMLGTLSIWMCAMGILYCKIHKQPPNETFWMKIKNKINELSQKAMDMVVQKVPQDASYWNNLANKATNVFEKKVEAELS